jgi:MFS family permease
MTQASDRYKWTALSNTTLGVFMALLDSSIVIISLPAIFRGIHLDPLQPANIGYLLWMLMGYLVCMAVLVVTFGRLGDIFGRVRLYNLGFAVFTVATIALSLTPGSGTQRGPVPHCDAGRPGRRWRPAHGQLDGHPD